MEAAHFPKEPADTGLTILDQLPKKKKNTPKVTKLTSCMVWNDSSMIKCFERSTVERIGELKRLVPLFNTYDNVNKYT